MDDQNKPNNQPNTQPEQPGMSSPMPGSAAQPSMQTPVASPEPINTTAMPSVEKEELPVMSQPTTNPASPALPEHPQALLDGPKKKNGMLLMGVLIVLVIILIIAGYLVYKAVY
jgi:uncharacterized protein HemX